MFTSVSLPWTPAVGRSSCLARSQRRCWAGSSASTSCGLTWSTSTSNVRQTKPPGVSRIHEFPFGGYAWGAEFILPSLLEKSHQVLETLHCFWHCSHCEVLAHKLLRSFRTGNIQQHATRNTCYSSKCSFYTGVQALRRRAVNIEPAKKKN